VDEAAIETKSRVTRLHNKGERRERERRYAAAAAGDTKENKKVAPRHPFFGALPSSQQASLSLAVALKLKPFKNPRRVSWQKRLQPAALSLVKPPTQSRRN
jgi:hypothetical protein